MKRWEASVSIQASVSIKVTPLSDGEGRGTIEFVPFSLLILTHFGKDGSEYVYRGGKMEKVMNFSQRIKRKYPNSKLVMRSEPKEKDLEENKQVAYARLLFLLS